MTLKAHLSLEGKSVSDWQGEYQMLMGKEQSSPKTEVKGRRWLSACSWHVKDLIFSGNNSSPCPISHFMTSSFVLFMLHQGGKKLYDFMSIILFVLVDILNVHNTVTMIWILLCEYKTKTLFIHCIESAGLRQVYLPSLSGPNFNRKAY